MVGSIQDLFMRMTKTITIAYEQDGNIKEALNNYKIFLTHSKDEATTKAVETKIKTLEK